MLNEIVTGRYFDKLSETITKLNLKEKQEVIWNMDEKSQRETEGHLEHG